MSEMLIRNATVIAMDAAHGLSTFCGRRVD
jgi:hypothetical protein